jgi:hypothetical protein
MLQTDAHMTFVTGWDEDVIGQFDAAGNDMAVLSTYPTEVEGSLDADGRSLQKTSPVMCATQFTGEGLLRHGSAIEIYPVRRQKRALWATCRSHPESLVFLFVVRLLQMFGPKAPVLHPFWAAGFS